MVDNESRNTTATVPTRSPIRKRRPKRKMSSHRLRIIPLGGLGEIGKNMMVLECGPDMVIIDAGLMFPSEDLLGIDLLIPDFTYVLENKERVRGIVITHGHEDHIGALPYLAQSLSVPVYASKLTARLIQSSSKQKNARTKLDLREMGAGEKVSFGTISLEFFPVCHSIPDAMGLIISTPIGTVVHTGDFKLDHTPVIGEPTDLHRLALIGTSQVLLLLSDSTYAELPGYTPSEEVVEDSLDRIISGAPGRVIIATFSSLVSRLQQAMDIAAKYKRSVIVTGRSMENIVKVASDAGYLRIPPKTLSRYEQVQNHPHDKIVVLTTGTQGEPTSALVRMANKEHQQIRIVPGDTVVMSATPIPGNERTVSRTINSLFRLGANVIYGAASHAHVHGHGSQEELKTILNLVRPKYFVPIHGEYRHLARHALMAEQMGIPKENVFLLEDGDVLELTGNSGKVVGKVPANDIVANGLVTGALDTKMLRDRRVLSRDGIVVVSVVLSPQTGKLVAPPEIVNKGFVDSHDNTELVAGAQRAVTAIASHRPLPKRKSTMEARIREALAKYLYDETHRRPVILPVVTGLETNGEE